MSTTRLETSAPTNMKWCLLGVLGSTVLLPAAACRSAVAEAVARTTLMNQWRLASAYLNVVPAVTMPEDAVAALNELGTSAGGHRAGQLTPELIAEADVVYCLTAADRDAVLALVPDAANKIASRELVSR